MDKIVAAVGVLAMLVLVGRGLPRRRWSVVLAVTLAIVLAVVAAERAGMWPSGWRVR